MYDKPEKLIQPESEKMLKRKKMMSKVLDVFLANSLERNEWMVLIEMRRDPKKAKSYNQTAQALRMPKSTVRNYYKRGILKIKKVMIAMEALIRSEDGK